MLFWCCLLSFFVGAGIVPIYEHYRQKHIRKNTEGTPSASHNTGMLADAQICQKIVEDQLDYLIRVGFDFKEDEKDCVRDNLYRIVAGKLQHT